MGSGFTLTGEPVPRGPGLWTLDGTLGSRLSTFPVRMTVVRGSGSRALLLVSSFPPDPAVLAHLRQLGEVRVILAPNAMHCLWGAQMRDACQGALLVGPPNAQNRFPALRWDAVVTSGDELAALLSQQGLPAEDVKAWTTMQSLTWMQEIVLLHRPSRTLIVTDLAFNFKPHGDTPLPGGPLGMLFRSTYMRLAGAYQPCCPSKPFRWSFLLRNPDALCSVLADIMSCDFDQVVMAHGDVVKAPGGKEAFKNGTVAFFQEAVDSQRRRREAGGPSRTLLAAGTVAAGAAAVYWLWQGRQ